MKKGVFAIALLCALAGVGRADNKQVAKDAYTEGKRHYDLGEYNAALDAFKKAYLNYEEPVFLFNIAQCYRQVGDRQGAVRTYRAFLRNWPKAPNRATVERIVAELEAAIAQDQAAKSAPPTETLEPDKARPEAPAAQAAVQPRPAPSTSAPKPAEPKPAPTGAAATPSAPAPAPEPAQVAAKPKPPSRADHTEMVEVEPNFDRPSGSAKPLKWWAWTLIAVGVGGLAAAAVAIGVSANSDSFNPTLPDYRVSAQALRTLEVRF
jgi:tetratricopeptide (TPR) repeat protein